MSAFFSGSAESTAQGSAYLLNRHISVLAPAFGREAQAGVELLGGLP